MKNRISFFIIFCVLHTINGCQQKSIIKGQEKLNSLDVTISDTNLIKSPREDYAFLVTDENKKDISTVIIVDLKDSTIIYRKNLYLDYACWISEQTLRIYERPEMVRKDITQHHFFDYDVKNENRQKK